jgi:transcriptional regulator GlxA family with amidase domain
MRRIAIAVFNGFALPAATTVVEVFEAANTLLASAQGNPAAYDVRLFSTDGGRIASASSMMVWTDSIDTRPSRDAFRALFIVGGAGARSAANDDRLVGWLSGVRSRSMAVFPLGEGRWLLDRIQSTGAQAARYDLVKQSDDMSHAGHPTPAAIDALQAALTVVREDLGVRLAAQVSDRVAPSPSLSTGMRASPAGRKHIPLSVSEKILEAVRWIDANADRPLTIERAAQIAAMSERTFLRRFKAEMGITPSEYLVAMRLEMCCRLLRETALPVDKVARLCGIGSGGRLSKLFRKHLSLTPTQYRAANRS